MTIKLKAYLDYDLLKIGLRPGDIIRNARMDNEATGAVYFDHHYVIINNCVVWPDNYEIIKADKPQPKVQFTIT